MGHWCFNYGSRLPKYPSLMFTAMFWCTTDVLMMMTIMWLAAIDHVTWQFSRWNGLVSSHRFSSPTARERLRLSGTSLLQAGCPSLQITSSVNALKEMNTLISTRKNGLYILALSFLASQSKEALLSLHWLSKPIQEISPLTYGDDVGDDYCILRES